MSYRKFRADHLFTGHEWFPGNYVLVTSDQGEVVEIIPAAEAGEDIQIFSGILTPGFINCHCHLELSHMKGVIPPKTGMIDFLLRVIQQRNFEGEVIKQAIINAENSMLQNGIVAVGDICNTTDTIEQKKPAGCIITTSLKPSGLLKAPLPNGSMRPWRCTTSLPVCTAHRPNQILLCPMPRIRFPPGFLI